MSLAKIRPPIDLFPLHDRILSAGDFLKLTPEEKRDIESVQVLLPKLGKKGFGRFKIRTKKPFYARRYGKK